MKRIVAGLLVFGAMLSGEAQAISIQKVQGLIERIHAKVDQFAEQPIIRFIANPTVPQGEPYTVFIQPESGYAKANIMLSAKLDGVDVSLEEPTAGLWVFSSPGFNEIRSHDLEISLSIEDADLSKSIRQAITQLDKDIAALQKLIDKTPAGPVKDDLIAQRDAKVALKNELILALERLKTFVGTQTFNFSVSESVANPDFPKITALNPNVGSVNGGTLVSVQGTNFAGVNQVVIAGVTLTPNTVAPTEVTFTTPSFSSLGAKDVELRAAQADGTTKNAILKNGFFAGVEPPPPTPIPNFAPVAVAGAAQSINLGVAANLNGSQSYDSNNDVISYSWKLISVPAGSALSINQEIGAAVNAAFTPDVPGVYAVELIVRETATPDLFFSAPSLTTVRAIAPANRAPTLALSPASATIGGNSTAQFTINTGDPDFWQTRKVLITTQPSLGTAQVVGNTLTYTSGTTSGSDSVGLTVVDNGEPILSATASVSIAINTTNLPPVIGGLATTQTSDNIPVRLRYNINGASDPDGSIVSGSFDFGDGTSGAANIGAFINTTHDIYTFAPVTVTGRVQDNLGAVTSLSANFDFTPFATNLRPVNRVVADVISGAAPLTVNFDATGTFDPEAQGFNSVRWQWNDGNAEQVGNTELFTNSHTFQNPGTYNVRFRTRDALNGESDTFIRIYVGTTPPAGGTAPTADFKFTPREVVIGTPFTMDGSRSLDPNPNGGILSYEWKAFDNIDCISEPQATCTYNTQVATHTFHLLGNQFPSLSVTNQNGATSGPRFEEVIVVNQGHAPRANFTLSPTSGVAPLTVNFNAGSGRSYDYDGTITQYRWTYGDSTPTDSTSGELASHTYAVPGVYFVNLEVEDNDLNVYRASNLVTVNSSLKVKPLVVDDEDRAVKRKMLTNACGAEQSEACYELAKMYEEDGDAFTAQKLFERACSLGYSAACQVAKWMKW